jgi:hypothetical protein
MEKAVGRNFAFQSPHTYSVYFGADRALRTTLISPPGVAVFDMGNSFRSD